MARKPSAANIIIPDPEIYCPEITLLKRVIAALQPIPYPYSRCVSSAEAIAKRGPIAKVAKQQPLKKQRTKGKKR
jgi:hypothetical protein